MRGRTYRKESKAYKPLSGALCRVAQVPTSSFACLFHLRELETKNSENWFNVRLFCKPIIYFDMISSLAKKTKATVHRNFTNSSTLAMAGRSEPQTISQRKIRIIHKSIVKVFSRLSFVCFDCIVRNTGTVIEQDLATWRSDRS